MSTDTLKKVASAILVVIVIAAVSFWQYSDQSSKQSVLEESLDLLGNKLLAMVPPGNGKATLAEVYDNFKQKAISGLVGEQEVEQVAANILNASNNQSELSPRQAKAIIVGNPSQSMQRDQLTVAGEVESTKVIMRMPDKRYPSRPPPAEFGEQIIAMVQLNDKMTATFNRYDVKRKRMAKHVRYRSDKGLRIELDRNLKELLPPAEFEVLSSELAQHGNLEWCEDLAAEIEMEIGTHTVAMDSLHIKLMQTHHTEIEQALAELEELRQLQKIGIPVNVDSIKLVVEQQLRSANIPPPPPRKHR